MGLSDSARRPWLVIRHLQHEHIGTIAKALERLRIPYRYVDVYRNDSVPAGVSGIAGLIVMGGSMGVYEADGYPFLTEEMALIRAASHAALPVLGICLGSQLIAAALGGRVYPGGRKEVGWYPVEVVDARDALSQILPPKFHALHWHGDTFDLPPGATHLFRSELYPNQGFRYRRNIYAFQFHFEVNASMIDDWLADQGCQAEIASVPGLTAQAIREDTDRYAAQLEHLSDQVFTRFFSMAETGK